MPAEIALIPFIESEFNPNDRSNKGATGLWQLMPQTARELGVKVKSGYDGRRNVVASTNAAVAYFNDLISNFNGNWYLAIAAYNAGPGRIISATRRSGTKSFWELRLPRETQLYLPKLLAVAAIVENPEKYGVELPPIENKPYFTEMTVKQPVTLDKMSQSTGVNVKTLRTLNPDVKNKTVPQKNGEHKVLVPLKKP
jgi:membrane-bound lytic murein transglycosylase D